MQKKKQNTKIKVAIQGFLGSYSHQALEQVFQKLGIDKEYELIENKTFHQAFQSIQKYGYGLIPVENSTAGFVEQTIDEMISGDFEIVGEFYLKINHTLLAKKKLKVKDIKKVYSHHQALLQTNNFLKENDIEMIKYFDTAGSAKFISESQEENVGAIGAEILSDIYDLKIIKKNINNEKDNTTRFFLIKSKKKRLKIDGFKKIEKNKVALIYKTKNISGALYKTLGGFATNNVNLLKILSHPVKGERFQYSFYLEFEGSLKDKKVQDALEELNFFASEVLILGEYGEIK